MKNFFSEYRFVFHSRGPEGPDSTPKGFPWRAMEGRKMDIVKKFDTARGRLQLLHSKKKVEGPEGKFGEKEIRVMNDRIPVIRTNGAADLAGANDKVRVAHNGQIYEIGGEKYVFAHVSRSTGEKRKFYAYLKVDDVNPRREAAEYKSEGEKLFRDFTDKLDSYLESEGLRDRLQVSMDTNKKGEWTVSIVDTYRRDTIVSWAMVDAGKAGPRATYLDEEHKGAPGASLVMGKPGFEGVPRPSERKRVDGKDSMHYSMDEGFKRALNEVNGYMGVHGNVQKPLSDSEVAKEQSAIEAGGKKLVKALKKELNDKFSGYNFEVEESEGQVAIVGGNRKERLVIVQVDPEGSCTVSVDGGTQAMKFEDVVVWMANKAIENLPTVSA